MSTRARSLLAEKKRREALPKAVDAALSTLFGKQRELVLDKHKRKVTHAGRRSGKTQGIVRRQLKAAIDFPGCTLPVFERSLTCEAANVFWKGIREMDDEFKLGMKFHDTLRRATFPNKSCIAIMGADTIETADKARGGKYPVSVIDEAGTFRTKILDYLITDVCEPASIDYDGEIIVAGTPNMTPSGTFWGLTKSPGWKVYHWELVDNIHMGPKDLGPEDRRAWRVEWLRATREAHNWTEASSKYVREYRGLWTDGADNRVYNFTREKNVIDALPVLPPGRAWIYALGMDMGFEDPTSWVIWARQPSDPHAYIVESFEESHLSPSSISEKTKALVARYGGFRALTADTGGLGKAVAAEMVERHGLPVVAAKKRDKKVHIEHMNDDFDRGRIKIIAGTNVQLIDDLLSVEWDADREDTEPNCRDHLTDAALYGHFEMRSWGLETDKQNPLPGTDAWEAAIELAAEREWRRATGRGEFRSDDDEEESIFGDPDDCED